MLTKRCVYFYGGNDWHKLLDGSTGFGGFEQIGSSAETAPLLLQNVLSYDEIKLSALLYVSTHSEFINNGQRANVGRVEPDKSKIEREGVIMGLIGSRFERENVMEWEDILITKEQNTEERGYGEKGGDQRLRDYRRIWREFYEEPQNFCYNDAKVDNGRFIKLDRGSVKFDTVLMSKRYAISFDALLLEAQARAVAAGKPAFIHVTGIGLGVWRIAPQQVDIFIDTFVQRLRALSKQLTHIGIVHFAWFHLASLCSAIPDGSRIEEPTHPTGGILLQTSDRNPADKLDVDMLPIVTYAWDGNALPGNEYWDVRCNAAIS